MKYIIILISLLFLYGCNTTNYNTYSRTKARIYKYDDGVYRYKGYQIKSGNKIRYYEYSNGVHRYKGYTK